MTSTLTQNELALCQREQARLDRRLRRWLTIVDRTGQPSSGEADEFLSINGLIAVTGPNERNPYNHSELTERARVWLATGKMA